MTSNYPPGVTGLEPQISGDWPCDPHKPWQVDWEPAATGFWSYRPHPDGMDCDPPGTWRVYLYDEREGEDGFLALMKDRETAERIAGERNALLAKHRWRPMASGIRWCSICGGLHPDDEPLDGEPDPEDAIERYERSQDPDSYRGPDGVLGNSFNDTGW